MSKNTAHELAKDAFDFAVALNCGIDDRQVSIFDFDESDKHFIDCAISHLQDALKKIEVEDLGDFG